MFMTDVGLGHNCSSYLCIIMVVLYMHDTLFTPQKFEGVAACTILFLPTPDGKIVRIVHAEGQTEISKAEHWVSLLHIARHTQYIDGCCNCHFFATPHTEVLSRS